MGLDVGVFKTEWLPAPEGSRADFAQYLLENCDAVTELGGDAFGFFEKAAIEASLTDFAQEHELTDSERRWVQRWAESLPYDEGGVVNLHFNW